MARPHICVLVSGVTPKKDVLLIPICSEHERCDRTCLIQPKTGWEEIRVMSFAAYYTAKKVSAKSLASRLESGDVTFLGKVPTHIFQRIIKGITSSDETEPWFLADFKALP